MRDACPPWGSIFFQFHAVFEKIWQNHMLVPHLGSWHPLLGEILDLPLGMVAKSISKFGTRVACSLAVLHSCGGLAHEELTTQEQLCDKPDNLLVVNFSTRGI